MTRAINKGHVPDQVHEAATQLAWRAVLLAAAKGLVTGGSLAAGRAAAVDLCVCVTQLDGNVALKLIFETDGLYA